MNKTLAISAIALIAAIMVIGTVSPTVFADKPEEKKNNGGNGCEKSNPNSKSCEKNPNTDPVTCQDCLDKYFETILVCSSEPNCIPDAQAEYLICASQVTEGEETCPAPR